MPVHLVLLAADALTPGPDGAQLEPLARLGHAGYAVAVILPAGAGGTAGEDASGPPALQALAAATDGQVGAFIHRAAHADGLADALAEVGRRWHIDPGQVTCVAATPADLEAIAHRGSQAVALATHFPGDTPLPPGCRLHADLGALVDALLDPESPE
jgi:hypothetical protein